MRSSKRWTNLIGKLLKQSHALNISRHAIVGFSSKSLKCTGMLSGRYFICRGKSFLSFNVCGTDWVVPLITATVNMAKELELNELKWISENTDFYLLKYPALYLALLTMAIVITNDKMNPSVRCVTLKLEKCPQTWQNILVVFNLFSKKIKKMLYDVAISSCLYTKYEKHFFTQKK